MQKSYHIGYMVMRLPMALKREGYDYPTNNTTYPCCGVGVGTYYQLFINNF
jgi:hypothetical protein